MLINHTIEPIYDEHSKVLVLGSIPSVKSREKGFYYAHPRNRFWKTLEGVYGEMIGETKEAKIEFLKKHHIALFDVIKSCEISASSDSSIKNPIPNDFRLIYKKQILKLFLQLAKKLILYIKNIVIRILK